MYKIEVSGPIPTINNMYSRNKKGLRFISPKHKKFKNKIQLMVIGSLSNKDNGIPQLPLFTKSHRLKLTIEVYFIRKGRDIDNIIKPIQDALKSVIFDDDSQIDELNIIRKSEKSDNEKIIIYIQEIKKNDLNQDITN